MAENPLIGLVMATAMEAAPFIKGLFDGKSEESPFNLYEKGDLCLILSGVGKVNAAMACAYLIQRNRPACICNLGAAGATGFQGSLGDCYQVVRTVEPDRPDLRTKKPREYRLDPLPGFPAATLATQDKPVQDPAERKWLTEHAQLIDMEGASIVQACRRFKTNCFLFKFVSDTPEHDETHHIIRNIEVYRDHLFRFFNESALPAIFSSL
jgi:adenosylhomocysteine nucleosidase